MSLRGTARIKTTTPHIQMRSSVGYFQCFFSETKYILILKRLAGEANLLMFFEMFRNCIWFREAPIYWKGHLCQSISCKFLKSKYLKGKKKYKLSDVQRKKSDKIRERSPLAKKCKNHYNLWFYFKYRNLNFHY